MKVLNKILVFFILVRLDAMNFEILEIPL